jgi:Flp pilus assembly protein TadG
MIWGTSMKFFSSLRNWRKLSAFSANRAGGVATMTALTLPIMVGSIGLALGVSNSIGIKSRLTAAADAAVLAGVKAGSGAAAQGDEDWLKLATAEANALFTANIDGENLKTVTFTPSFERTGTKVVGQARYSYGVPTYFMHVFGFNYVEVGQTSKATVSAGNYVDIGFLVDNSASMGIGATKADRGLMNASTGCAFACHQARNASELNMTPPMIHRLGAKLRIDVIREALEHMIDEIDQQDFAPDQVRVSIYAFSNEVETVIDKETDLTKVKQALEKLDLATGTKPGKYYGGSYVTPAINWLATEFQSREGKGGGASKRDRQRYAILLTDGIEDSAASYADGRTGSLDTLLRSLFGVEQASFFSLDMARRSTWIDNPLQRQVIDRSFMQPFLPTACDGLRAAKATVYTARIKYDADGINQRVWDVPKIEYATRTRANDFDEAFRKCASDLQTNVTAETSSEIGPMLDKIVQEILVSSKVVLSE